MVELRTTPHRTSNGTLPKPLPSVREGDFPQAHRTIVKTIDTMSRVVSRQTVPVSLRGVVQGRYAERHENFVWRISGFSMRLEIARRAF